MALKWAGEEEDPTLTNQLTPGTSSQVPPTAPPPPPVMAPEPPQIAPQAPIQAKPPLAKPMPGMPPDVTPDELGGYLNKQKSNMGKFGPDDQMNLVNDLAAQRNGLGYKATDALKGFSDALMQGVAEAGNPGNQAQFENLNMSQGQERLGAMQKAHEGQMQETEAGMKMDMMDAKSPISNSYRQSFSPIFSKMGYPPASVAKMSAAQIATVADLGVRFADAQTQLELKKALLGVQEMSATGTLENQKAQRSQEEQKMKLEHPFLSAIGGISSIPAGAADFESTYATIPKGQSYKGPDGKMRIKQ